MTNVFYVLAHRCGLSQREVAEFLNVSDNTVNSWSSGRRTAPTGVIEELRELYGRIEKAANEALAVIKKSPKDAGIELGISVDDAEAESLGWPCVGAHAAVLGIVAAKCGRRVKIVPRGSTTASAAACDAHGK